MKILVKIGSVEITYQKEETIDSSANAATCKENWHANAVNDVLLGTISHMAKEAKELYKET
jgi:hypothetical protein